MTHPGSPLRFLVQPNRHQPRGQDLLALAMLEHCRMSVFDPNLGPYPPGSLVVCKNPDSSHDADIISSLAAEMIVAVHVHCQYSYYEPRQLDCIRRCLSRASVGVTPAAFSTREFARRFPDVPWRTAGNGIDRARFRPSTLAERKTWRREQGIPDDRLLVAVVGRLEAAKGLQILEEFVRRLATQPLVHLLIQYWARDPGDSSFHREANRLSSLAPGAVTCFPDQVLSQDRPLRFVDLLFTPSLSEVCPLTVLEAFHCGVPVLATRSTPFHSDLDPSAWPEGFLQVQDLPALNERSHSRLGVAPAVARDLAGKFLELAARMRPPDDPCRIQLSQAAFQAGFDQGRMFQLLNQIYDEVVARHHTLKQTH